jgi:hypothetical protein
MQAVVVKIKKKLCYEGGATLPLLNVSMAAK